MSMESEIRLKVIALDGSIKFSETVDEKIGRLEKMIVARVGLLESRILKPNGGFALSFRENLIDEELNRFFFCELLPEIGKVRFIEDEEK